MAKAYWKVLGATKQGYLWIAAALKVVMLLKKWCETQSKGTALSISLFKVVCGWTTQ